MSNFETRSVELAPTSKTRYSTIESTHKPRKHGVVAVEPKIARKWQNKWPSTESPDAPPSSTPPEAAVSTVHGANVAAGHTWNLVSSRHPQLHLRGCTIPIKSFPSAFGLMRRERRREILAARLPMQRCPAVRSIVADSGGSPASSNAISPVDHQAHGPSLGWLPDVFRGASLDSFRVEAVQTLLPAAILPAILFLLIISALGGTSKLELPKSPSLYLSSNPRDYFF
ncbi:hypothetical protein B0H11DRAFT_2247528 [Mycena galericulata]|nr:hypothetical protein B0H11DRAFT_2247528 [Mycena galericulata]